LALRTRSTPIAIAAMRPQTPSRLARASALMAARGSGPHWLDFAPGLTILPAKHRPAAFGGLFGAPGAPFP
jgi:hypothetical protein